MSKSAETEYGAIYNRKDYLGLGRRLGIVVVDLIVFSAIALILAFIASIIEGISGLKPDDPMTAVLYMVPIMIAGLIYFPVLKATRIGTVGYMLFKAQLVNLKGERASIVKSTVRFMFFILGPFNFIFDLIWLGSNKQRQTFRDLFVGTYVIGRKAEPVSRGRIIYPTYDVLGWNFVCSEVEDDVNRD